LGESAASKSSPSPTDANGSPSLLPRSSGSECQYSSIKEPAFPNKESESAKEPRAGGLVSNEEGAKEEAKENHTFLSPDQETRVKKAASGFTNSTEMLIRNANSEARLLCQEGTHMSSASARAATKEIVRILVDALVRCKDRKKMDEQIRIEEEWIENEVERKIKERRFEDEVSKRVMEEMDQRSKHKAEEIREIGRAAQRGWGFLNPDQGSHQRLAGAENVAAPNR
jgi:hypothetical protein